jgi:uncharacterized protein
MDSQITPNLNTKQKTIIISGVVLAILFPLAMAILIGLSHMNYPEKILYSRFIFWAEVLLLMLYAYKIERQKFFLWEDKRADVGFFVASVVILYLLSIACSIVSSAPKLFGAHDNNAVLKRIAFIFMNRPWLMVFTAFTAGVTEELIFRVYILTRLSSLIKNQYIPVIITSLTFMLLHYSYKSWREYIFVFLIGMVFGIYYQKYRNIKALIVVHFMIDMISLEIATHFYKLIK